MAAPAQITATYLVYSGASPAVVTTTTVVIPVPAILQSLDSGQTAASQTGISAWDSLLSGIVKAGGIRFASAPAGVPTLNFIPVQMLVSITSP